MMDAISRVTAALSRSYRLERELGAGGMARELVTEVTARLMSLKRQVPGFRGHFSDLGRALKDSLAPGSRWRAPKGRSVAVASATSRDDPAFPLAISTVHRASWDFRPAARVDHALPPVAGRMARSDRGLPASDG